jgi:hypothetical protein
LVVAGRSATVAVIFGNTRRSAPDHGFCLLLLRLPGGTQSPYRVDAGPRHEERRMILEVLGLPWFSICGEIVGSGVQVPGRRRERPLDMV